MKFLLGVLFLAVAVSAQGGQEITEEQMETIVKPCVIDNICPPGENVDYELIESTIGLLKLAALLETGTVPDQCDDDCDSERCNRVCYYALMKEMMRIQREKQASGEWRRKRFGHRRRR